MASEENKAVVRRWLEAWSTRDVGVLDALADKSYTDDFVVHDKDKPAAVMGREGVKQFVRAALKNTPDIVITLQDLIAEGDRVVARYTVSGTEAATGKKTGSLLIDIYRFANGKYAEMWAIDAPAG